MDKNKTIVILGPTASGKTGVSIEIAKEIERIASTVDCQIRGAEIISADSRAIYRGMEIGTAAPSREEMQGVIHHGVGIIEPDERFTVADWKKVCRAEDSGNSG